MSKHLGTALLPWNRNFHCPGAALEQTSNEPCKQVAEENSTAVRKAAIAETLVINGRESRGEIKAVTPVRIHHQLARKQDKRQLEQQGTPTRAGVPEAECMLTTEGLHATAVTLAKAVTPTTSGTPEQGLYHHQELQGLQ
jgi:hypothetical protein